MHILVLRLSFEFVSYLLFFLCFSHILCSLVNNIQEWITPQPSRRPDIFPEFERLDTPLPKPLPGDPEMPDEEEEEEEEKKKKNPDEPEKEDEPKPDEPAPAQE